MKENTVKARLAYEKDLKKCNIEFDKEYILKKKYILSSFFSSETKFEIKKVKFSFWYGQYEISPVVICDLGETQILFANKKFILDGYNRESIINTLDNIKSCETFDISLLKDFINLLGSFKE